MTDRAEDDAILAEVLHPERQVGRIELVPCPHYPGLLALELDAFHACMTPSDLNALRDRLGLPSGAERPLAAIRFLAALDGRVLREAVQAWQHEHPGQEGRLRDLLAGAAEPAWKSTP